MNSRLSEYSYCFIVCEGTNEEAAVNWILENNSFAIDQSKVNMDYCRARTKSSSEEMIADITTYDYDGKVAILYVHDSKNEKWHGIISKSCAKELKDHNFEVIDVITAPEIEIICFILDEKLYKKWNKATKKKPSDFLRENTRCKNIKQKGAFRTFFASFDDFVCACKKYKQNHNSNFYTLFDLIDQRARDI